MTSGKIQSAIQLRQEKELPLINLSFADFTFYDSLLTRKKIRKAFANVFRYPYYYPTAKGESEALDAVCDYYKRQKREVDPGSLILTASVNQACLYLLRLFSSDGGEVLVPKPFSPAMDEVAAFLGQELKTYSLQSDNGWQIDLEDLAKKITTQTRAIFLMSPHLPTGAIQSEETLRKLLKLLKDKKIALIMDESLSDFVFNKTQFPVLAQLSANRQLVVTLQTLSNAFALPGLKLSWMQVSGPKTAAAELISRLEMLADTFLNLNQLSQTILPEVVRYSRRWRHRFQKVVEKNRDILVGKLSKAPRLQFHYPEGGFYALIEVLPPETQPAVTKTTESDAVIAPTSPESASPAPLEFTNSEDFSVQLLEKTGVYVHPGTYYGLQTGCYFMTCFLQNPSTLRKSLKKIVKFLKPPK